MTNKYDKEIQSFIREITTENRATSATEMIRHWETKPTGLTRLLERIRVFFRTPVYGSPYNIVQKNFLLGIASYCEGELKYGCRKEYTGDLLNDKIW